MVCMDYMFMGSKIEMVQDEEGERNTIGNNDAVKEEFDDTKAKLLVMRDSKSKAIAAIPVKRKK